MTPASASTSSTGTQSAARTISTTPGCRVTSASALGRDTGAVVVHDDHVAAVHLDEVAQLVVGREVVEQAVQVAARSAPTPGPRRTCR